LYVHLMLFPSSSIFYFLFYFLTSLFILLFFFFFYCYAHHLDLHSFPTRRSSDLSLYSMVCPPLLKLDGAQVASRLRGLTRPASVDRKSTRLNSSHSQISYAVFCLKKKKKKKKEKIKIIKRKRKRKAKTDDVKITI